MIVTENELGQCLRVRHPAAALVACEKQIFLGIVNITGLKLGGINDLPELELKYLRDESAKVDLQILRLTPAMMDIDPTGEHDWC